MTTAEALAEVRERCELVDPATGRPAAGAMARAWELLLAVGLRQASEGREDEVRRAGASPPSGRSGVRRHAPKAAAPGFEPEAAEG